MHALIMVDFNARLDILRSWASFKNRRFAYYRTPRSQYRVIPGSRNWQVETADWNLDVRLDI